MTQIATTKSVSGSIASTSTPIGGSGATAGADLVSNNAVRAGIDAIVREVQRRSARVTDVRGPVEGLREGYEALMKRAADTRGRALLYPYLGSGVGNGALVELADGSVKWDMICGIGVHFFGHSDPESIGAALEGGLSDIMQHGNLQANFDAYEFAEVLLAEAKKHSRLKYAYLSTSGAMANENAIKVCYQKHAPASRVIAFKDCFMGRSVTMSQIGDAAANRIGIPLSTLVDYVPFYDEALAAKDGMAAAIEVGVGRLRELIERYPKQHACFIFELVQGEGGFNTAPREFFVALMDLCKQHSIAVWDDEIQTFGRTETMFAYEKLDLGDYVDVFCVGKMTQVCATLFSEEYNPGPGLLSGTFTSTTSAYKVGKRVIERLRDGAYYGPKGSIARHFGEFGKQVKALAAKHPEWFPKVEPAVPDIVGGTGGMMRFTPFGGKKDRITKLCRHLFDEGVITFYAGHGPYHVRMLPPLGVFDAKDWPRVFECVERGMAKAAAE
ncbi:MAG: aminotransferase class III-fold pyridoxal phosphate-dependent enzyme [Phycisphaerales bacterium]|nr:aminotransferase class III-fold pyridoxal phosphate-dependent enzyme [Phycisphaerales bacterium]